MFDKIPTAAFRWASWAIWLILVVGILSTVQGSISSGNQRTVVDIYRNASLNWISGKPLYAMTGHGFLYLPQGAIVFIPWGILPANVCEIVWRLSIILVAACSAVRLTQLFDGDSRYFFAITVATVVLGMGTARVGQSTMMIMGLNLLAIVELSEGHWWRSTLLLMLGIAFKPLGIVLVLLIGALRPQMSYRLALGMIVVALLPFLTQRPDYVLTQYQACLENMRQTFRVGETEYWAQLFGMLKVWGVETPAVFRTIIRLTFALATLFVCWQATRKLPVRQSSFYVIAFASVYLMLFHSRTEGNTYSMVGPVYGALLADAFYRRKNVWTTAALDVAIILTLLHYELGRRVFPVPREVWLSPCVCSCVTCYLVFQLLFDMREASLDSASSKDAHEERSQVHVFRAAA
jgi:hypothetical protein